MTNMSYCRFENTYRDLRDCAEDIDDEAMIKELSKTEFEFRGDLISLCRDIIAKVGDENEDDIRTLWEQAQEESDEEL